MNFLKFTISVFNENPTYIFLKKINKWDGHERWSVERPSFMRICVYVILISDHLLKYKWLFLYHNYIIKYCFILRFKWLFLYDQWSFLYDKYCHTKYHKWSLFMSKWIIYAWQVTIFDVLIDKECVKYVLMFNWE